MKFISSLFTRFCNWWSHKEHHFQVAVPTLEHLEQQTRNAKQELVQQKLGTRRESHLRQRVQEELDLELKLLRLNKGKMK